MEVNESDEESTLGPQRLTWAPPTAIALVTISNIFTAVSNAFHDWALCLLSHANWKSEREEFQREASLAIETITGSAE